VEAAESLLADYEKVEVLRSIPEVPAEEIPAVQAKIEESFHRDIAKLATVTTNPKEIVSSLVVIKSISGLGREYCGCGGRGISLSGGPESVPGDSSAHHTGRLGSGDGEGAV